MALQSKNIRNFHLFGLSVFGGGTTSIAGLLSRFHSKHEFEAAETIHYANDYLLGNIQRDDVARFLTLRDRRGNLEMDSAGYHWPYVDILVELFPEAKYIIVVRDCYSWVNSLVRKAERGVLLANPWVNNHVQIMMGATDLSWLFGKKAGLEYEEALMGSVDIWLPNLLRYWAKAYTCMLETAPQERTLILRLPELSTSIAEIGEFVGVPRIFINRELAHQNRTPTADAGKNDIPFRDWGTLVETFLPDVSECKPLMERFFPELQQT